MAKCRVRPLGNRIAVVREEPEGKSKGGILLPDVAKEAPKRGRVVAVGPGHRVDSGEYLQPEVELGRPVRVGDTVLFTAYAGSEVKVDEETYLVLAIPDCVAVLEE